MKSRPNKLDAFGEQIDQWLGSENLTLAEGVQRLAEAGCSSSLSALSKFWERRQSAKLQERLLGQIASGARQCREVEAALGKEGAPELDTLIKLHRVLILKLSSEGNANPEMLEVVRGMMSPVMEFAKLGLKREELSLSKEKFRRETCELFLQWNADQRAKEIASGASSNSQKIQQLGKLMFGEDF